MGKAKVTLYVDVLSPFGYIAYWLTRNSPAFTSQAIDITYVPILLGGLMQQCENTPPLHIKNKNKWINNERTRWQNAFSVPFADKMPSPFPQPTANTQRALCYLEAQHPEQLAPALDALFRAFWVEGKTIGKPDAIQETLKGALGEELTGKVMEGMKSDEAKAALKRNTDKSFRDGAFGLPWFVATNEKGQTEGFWGVDHIGQLLDFVGVQSRGEGGFRALL